MLFSVMSTGNLVLLHSGGIFRVQAPLFAERRPVRRQARRDHVKDHFSLVSVLSQHSSTQPLEGRTIPTTKPRLERTFCASFDDVVQSLHHLHPVLLAAASYLFLSGFACLPIRLSIHG